MRPDDPRHGTNAGSIAGCRQACCRRAHAAYRRGLRTRTYLTGVRKVDGTGTRRRIRALMALGWSSSALDRRLGRKRSYVSALLTSDGHILRETRDAVTALYDALCMTVADGPYAIRNQRAAARKGWPPPLAWDDIDTDEHPHGMAATDVVDEVLVQRVVSGEHALARTASPAERRVIVARFRAAGLPLIRLERVGLKPSRYDDEAVA